jgi:tetratricopeptide (TPR) repeat protein
VSTEKHEKKAHEQELWDRISTTTGADRAETLDELSHLALKRNEWKECLSLVESSIEIYNGLGKDLHTSDLLHVYEGAAHCLRHLERWSEAAQTYQLIADLEKDNNLDNYLGALRNVACSWYSADEYEKALNGHQAVVSVPDPDANDYSIGIDILNIGMCYSELKRPVEAIDCYLEARKYFQKSKSPTYVNWCDRYLAEDYLEIENGPEAKFHSKHFYNFTKVAEDFEMEGYARHFLGKAHYLCGEFEEAQNHLTAALSTFTCNQSKDWEDILDANRYLSKVLSAFGQDVEAAEILERIKTIEETMGE